MGVLLVPLTLWLGAVAFYLTRANTAQTFSRWLWIAAGSLTAWLAVCWFWPLGMYDMFLWAIRGPMTAVVIIVLGVIVLPKLVRFWPPK